MTSLGLFDLHPYALLPVVFFLVIFFGWLGYRFKKYRLKKHPEIMLEKGKIQGAALGILSLLMGFTFSVAMAKFETQRRVITQEAAYINTAILRCDIYPDSLRSLLREDLKEYVEARIAYYDTDSEKSELEREKAELIAKRIWEKVVLQMQISENVLRSGQMIPAINNMIDIVITRDGEKISKVPFLVLWVLLIFILIDAFVLGGDLVDKKSRAKIVIVVYAIVMSLTLNLIIELHQTRTGLINLDAVQHQIIDLRELLK
jgi:FtsH-binding integral membrane protein